MVRASLENILQNDSRDHIHASFEFLVFVDRTISSIDFSTIGFFFRFSILYQKRPSIGCFIYFLYLLKITTPQRNVLNKMVYKHFLQFSTGKPTPTGSIRARL